MDFNFRLKQLRESKGLTQKQFVEEFNNYHIKDNIGDDTKVYIQTVSYWENGREANYNVLVKLAHFFNVSIDYLLGNSDIKEVKEYEYMSNIRELNKDNINKVISDFTEKEKAHFFESLSRYIYNLRLNTALIENRSLNKNDLDYITYLSDITTIIDEFSENIFDLFIEFDNGSPVLKKNLLMDEFKKLISNQTATSIKLSKLIDSIQELCLKIAYESTDIEIKK
ncbi:MAG: helix-turn-helix transcriptional regulator [Clostridium sp.]|nr:helix-turn-helix transcriptional regulator [Clostridium sp.]